MRNSITVAVASRDATRFCERRRNHGFEFVLRASLRIGEHADGSADPRRTRLRHDLSIERPATGRVKP